MIEYALRHEHDWKRLAGDVPVYGSGILPSEALLICGIGVAQGVDVFVESGRKQGYSTSVLCSHVPHFWRQVYSVESHPNKQTDRRLTAQYPSLVMLTGDGRELVPRVVKVLADNGRRVGVLLDGPKGAKAWGVVDEIADSVCFVGVHDCHCVNQSGEPNLSWAECVKRGVYNTAQDADFAAAVGHLDAVAWRGTYSSRDEMTRHGFGLGIMQGGRWCTESC